MALNNKPSFVLLLLAGCIAGILMSGVYVPIQEAYSRRAYIKRVQKYQKEVKDKKDAMRDIVRSQFQYIVKDNLPIMANIIVYRGVTYLVKM